jgi:pyruvate/2-oxoglutarate/acetoin dehydrogenase E1 component
MPINNKQYQQNLKKAMEMLAKDNKVIFIGQTVEYPGSPMFGSLENVDKKKKLELPVFENTQMGISIGLALEGFIPVSIFPRIDFLICGTDQLVNHLDKVEEMSQGEFKPGVIIRTQIGNTKPIYPGAQHCGDYTKALKLMCKNVAVHKIKDETEVIPLYKMALERAKMGLSTLLVEVPTGAFGK